MREILFKAKRTDTKEWVEGYPFPSKPGGELNQMTIFEDIPGGLIMAAVEIDPETLCEFTELTDKNGVKIFEGDIVLVSEKRRHKTRAMWDSGNARFVLDVNQPDDTSLYMCKEAEDEYEVIGSIHDEVTP